MKKGLLAIQIALLSLLAFLAIDLHAQIYQEDFNSYANGTTTGTGSKWTTSITSASTFAVQDGRFEARTLGGTTRTWASQTINISGFAYVRATIQMMASGGLESADGIAAQYNLDGTGWYNFPNDGQQSNGFSIVDASTYLLPVSGGSSTLQIRVRFNNNSAYEAYYIDNVVVQGFSSNIGTNVHVPCTRSQYVWLEDFNAGNQGWTVSGGSGVFGTNASETSFEGGNLGGTERNLLTNSIAVSAADNITLSVDFWNSNNMGGADRIRFFYLLNGSAVEIPFATNPVVTNSVAIQSRATATFTGATSVRIKVYMVNNGAAKSHFIDNLAVIKSTSSINLDFKVDNLVTCNTPNAQISVTGNTSGLTFQWDGQNGSGFSSTSATPAIPFQDGDFSVIVSNATYSCQSAVFLTKDVSFPDLTVNGGYINCSSPSTVVNAISTTVPGTTFSWTGPSGFTSTSASPTVTNEGVYKVAVKHPATGCTNIASILIAGPNTAASWVENFTGLANGTINDAGATAWSRDVSATDIPASPASRFFEVQNEKFKISYTVNSAGPPHEEAVWTSQSINISGLSNVQAFVDLQSEGNLNSDATQGSYDFIRVYYKLNGSSTEIPFINNGINSGDVPPVTASTGAIAGSNTSIVIVIRAKNTFTDEVYYVDNISVYGTRPAPVFDMTMSTAVNGPITCTNPTRSISATSNAPGATFSWTGPGGFTSSSASPPPISVAGTYNVSSVGSIAGCGATGSVVVTQNKTLPDASASDQVICSGNTTSIAITNPNGVAATSFSWTRVATNVTGSANGSGNTISQTLSSTDGVTSGTVNYSITPASAAYPTGNGCVGTPIVVTATVNPIPTAPTGSSTQTFCSTSNPKVSDLVATGASVKWYTVSSGGVALASGTSLITGTTYYASQTTSGCESVSRFAVTVTIVTNPSAPTGTSSQTFCTINNPTVANLTATGTSIQWYSASTGGSALLSSTALTSGTTYYASQTSGGCESVSRFSVSVTLTNPSAPTGTSSQTFCSINNPTVANLTATGTSIKWYSASTGGSALLSSTALTSGTTYYASQTSGGCESVSRFSVAVTINNSSAPTGTSSQTFCSINNPTVANLTATGTSIQWYSVSTGGSALLSSTALTNGTTYYASQISGGCESVSRFSVSVTLTNPSAPTGTSSQTFCSINNPTVANLTAAGTSIQWYSASTGGSALLNSTALTNGTTYYASQVSGGCESVSRFSVSVTLTNPSAPTGTSSQTFCSIINPTVANLTATGTSIQWYSASTGGSALLSSTVLTNGTTYYASQISGGCESVSRFSVSVTLGTPSAPTGTSSQTFCSITNPTVANLSATGTAIKWYSASTGGSALLSSTALTNGTTYYASQTSGGCESVSRFSVSVTLTNPSAPTGTSSQTFCSITNPTVANLTATGTSIQWYSASTGGSALLSSTALTNGTTYYASQISGGCESVSRFSVSVTLTNPSTPTGTSAQTFCSITNPTVANLTATGTSIQWYSASTGGSALLSSTALTNGTTYYASQISGGCESVSRFSVTVTITNPAAPSGASSQTFCSINNPTVANLTATGTSIQWYSTSTGGTALVSSTALTTGTNYYASQTVTGCQSATRFTVTVTITNPSAPTGSMTQNFCSIDNPKVSDLVAAGTGIQWYSASTGGTALLGSTALTTGTTYYASQTVGGCESNTRLAVNATVSIPSAPTGSSTQAFCSINNPTVSNLAATGTSIKWYSIAVGGTALAGGTALLNGNTYYASQTLGSCESASRLQVTITINNPSAPTGALSQTFCSISNATVADLIATGTSLQWYSTSTGGTALLTTTALATATNYYASQTVGGCESASRFATAVTITNTSAPGGTASQTFCSINNPTVANLSAAGTTIKWYGIPTGGTTLSSGTALITGTTYYASQTVGGCESASRLNVAVTVTNPSAPTSSVTSQSFCSSSNATIANLSATGSSIKWYSSPTSSIALSSTASLASTTYHATQTVGGCESASRLAVTVTVNLNPNVTTAQPTYELCNGASTNIVISNPNSVSGTSYSWVVVNSNNIVGASDGTGNSISQKLTTINNNSNGTLVYRITPVANGCTGASTDAAVTVNNNIGVDVSKSGNITCSNTGVTLIVASSTSRATYTWNGPGVANVTGSSIVVNKAGSYTVSASNGSGCESSGFIDVNEDTDAPSIEISSIGVFNSQSASVQLVAQSNKENVQFMWTGINGLTSLQSELVAPQPGEYTVTVTDTINGCLNTATIRVNQSLLVSEGFSPNNDGNNDTWYIRSIEEYTNNSIKVFDRWGILVYQSRQYDNTSVAWGGRANVGLQSGTLLDQGTYYYSLDLGNGSKTLSGFVEIVR